jgi:hypothetical protein
VGAIDRKDAAEEERSVAEEKRGIHATREIPFRRMV